MAIIEHVTEAAKTVIENKGSYIVGGGTMAMGADEVYHILPGWFPTGEIGLIAGAVLTITLIVKNWIEIRRDLKDKKEKP